MKKKWLILLLFLAVIILLVVLYFLFGREEKGYTITFDTNGGPEISEIEVKNGKIVKLPESPKKDGYIFVAWKNEDGKVITKGTKVNKDIILKAEWIRNDVETVTIEFDTDGGNEIDNIIIEKGKNILLPVDPIKEGYIFACWVDKDGNFVTKDMIVTENITLKAMWIKEDAKTVTIKFDTDGGSSVEDVIVESGKQIILPIDPTKADYVFAGWVDEKGNKITKDTIVNEDMTVKAVWKEPYSCPSDCTPFGDGSKCKKTTTKELVINKGCPSGTETVEKFCSAHQKQVAVGFDENITYQTAGIICDDKPKGFCVDYNNRYSIRGESCPSGYYKYSEVDGLSGFNGCAKKYDKGGSSCPKGYKKSGNVCKKTEIINCKAN